MISKMKELLEQYSKIVSVLFVVLSIGFGSWLGYVQSNSVNLENHQEETKKTKLIQEKAEFAIQQLGPGAFLATGMNSVVLTSNYILAQDLEYELQGDTYITKKNVVRIYRIETPEQLYKEYDLVKLSQYQSPSLNPRKILENLYINGLDQNIYFAFDYIDINKNKMNSDLLMEFVNIESGQRRVDSESFTKADSTHFVKDYDAHEKLSDYGLVLATSTNGYVALEAAFDKEPQLKALRISQVYPQLEKELKAGKSFVLTGEQAYAELVKLLAKEGEEDLYTGLKLSQRYSIDGQEHILQSYQDFLDLYRE